MTVNEGAFFVAENNLSSEFVLCYLSIVASHIINTSSHGSFPSLLSMQDLTTLSLAFLSSTTKLFANGLSP